MVEDGREIYIINPNRPSIMGIDTFPSLTAIGKPVDALVSLIPATLSTELLEEAAIADVGGAVVIAAGFGEIGGDGLLLQERLSAAARSTGMAVIGPNCLGYADIRNRISLARRIEDLDENRPGGITLVSQSGSMMHALGESVRAHRYLGLSKIISVGNEAVTDLADYVEFLALDAETDAIVLVIEAIRRPAEFFRAVELASTQGKVIVAIKLARSERSRQMAASHTGALAGDAWVYEVALRQAGVIMASDPDEAIDRLQFIAQIPRESWAPTGGVGVITGAGGMASLSFDIATEEDVPVPSMDHLVEWLTTKIPGLTVANPLDVPELYMAAWGEIVAAYEADDEVDAIVWFHVFGENELDMGLNALRTFTSVAESSSKPFVISPFAIGLPGAWVDEEVLGKAGVGRGLRSTMRGLNTMGKVVAQQRSVETLTEKLPSAPISRPECDCISTAEGRLLPFANAMALLSEAGVPTVPFVVVNPEIDAAHLEPGFGAPFVVKLADVAHRTEIGAVRVGVTNDVLSQVIRELRELAAEHDVPRTVVIQPQVSASAEVFVGIQITELGPLVVFGIGGVFVNVLKRIGGRMAPFGAHEARALLEEFADLEIMQGFRGQGAWDLDELSAILVAAGHLAAAGFDWIDSIDMNPIILGPDGFVAVDILCLVK
jgi:acyl-CoA synthetase (NDP forming)